MKAISFAICFFINVVIFGIFAYGYLIWIQIWKYSSNLQNQKDTIDLDMSMFNEDYQEIIEYNDITVSTERYAKVVKRSTDQIENEKRVKALNKMTYGRLRQALLDEEFRINSKNKNEYHVTDKWKKSCKVELRCQLKLAMKGEKFINKTKTKQPLSNMIPHFPLFHGKSKFEKCAVISSAGAMLGSNLGKFIDSHDVVMRFNNAPTEKYEKDVGSKTSIRILNSQILSKPEFNFQTSNLNKNISLLVWDASKYKQHIKKWLLKPDHDFIQEYIKFRTNNPGSDFQIINPKIIWRLWDLIQCHTSHRIQPNSPSSGFIGLSIMLDYCKTVNMFEYVPSERVSQRCHYYSSELDSKCTYGIWHPIAAEKLLALRLNNANDTEVFITGYVSIPGYNVDKC